MDDVVTTWTNRNAGFPSLFASGILISHGADSCRRRPDKLNVTTRANFGEMGVLGQEPISGMNRIDISNLGRTDDPIDLQIAFRTLSRTNTHRFVGQLHM